MAKRSIRVSMEEADEILGRAYDNGYRLLVEGMLFRDLEIECVERGEDLYLTYFRDEGPDLEDMEEMKEWYEDLEEYERCAGIRDYIRSRFPKKGK